MKLTPERLNWQRTWMKGSGNFKWKLKHELHQVIYFYCKLWLWKQRRFSNHCNYKIWRIARNELQGKVWPGLNFINVLCTAFTLVGPKSVKRYWRLDWVLTLWGTKGVKAVRRKLMKSSPGVNFINVLREHFSYKIFVPKITKLCFGFETFWHKNFVQKARA